MKRKQTFYHSNNVFVECFNKCAREGTDNDDDDDDMSSDISNPSSVTSARSRRVRQADRTREEVERDDQLVKELNELSMEERQKVYEDIHGVSATTRETPEFVQSKLEEMQREILKIRERSEYEKAYFLSPRYVSDPKFRLVFLRCDGFDARAAAGRYVRHFAHKLYLFGHDKLVKDITQADLGKDATEFLRIGFMQVLPQRDSSGRPVMMFFNRLLKYKDAVSAAQASWYCFMGAIQYDEVAQTRGFVSLAYECIKGGAALPYDLTVAAGSIRLYNALPKRAQAYHFCYDDPTLAPTMTLVKYIVGRQGRIRFRSHFGSDTECRYQLMAFGIPVRTIPVTPDGYADNTYYYQWLDQLRNEEMMREAQLQVRQQITSLKTQSLYVAYPSSRDVVMGRGRPYQLHPGNKLLNTIVDGHWRYYESANRSQKMSLFSEIVAEMKSKGTRFLRKRTADDVSPGQYCASSMERSMTLEVEWEEVDDMKAREKVSHTFRNRRLSLNTQTKRKAKKEADT